MLPPDEIEDLYIWYFESDKPIDGLELELMNSDNGEVLDRIRLKHFIVRL